MTPLISPTRDDTPLQATREKKAKDKRMANKLIDESEFCLAGKNQSGPVSVFMQLDLSYALENAVNDKAGKPIKNNGGIDIDGSLNLKK